MLAKILFYQNVCQKNETLDNKLHFWESILNTFEASTFLWAVLFQYEIKSGLCLKQNVMPKKVRKGYNHYLSFDVKNSIDADVTAPNCRAG